MRRFYSGLSLALCVAYLGFGCGHSPPDDVLDYANSEKYILIANEIPPTPSDPHIGIKNIYGGIEGKTAAETAEEFLDLEGKEPFVYPDGTLIIKTSRREHQDYVWLVATARKVDGEWEWTEYKRNFEDEDFLDIPVSQDVCVGCHDDVEKSDYIFSKYQAGAL